MEITTLKKSKFLAEALGALRAETGMYKRVHKDFEHNATPRFTKKEIF